MSTTQEPDVVAGNTTGRHLGLALAVISCAQLMIVLDATVVTVALPTIHASLGFSAANLQWLITAYLLTFGGLLIFGGRTGDLYGKKRMFMAGVAVFAIASLLGGLAQSDTWLIITRACQGVGAAIASPTALSLVAITFPEGPSRNRAMGVYAGMSAGGGAIGLLLGGILVGLVSWRWIFFVNVPIAAAVLLLAPRALNESETTSGSLDVPGAMMVTIGMASLVYGLSGAATHSWGSPNVIAPLCVAVVLIASFLIVEMRIPDPLMPLGIFANRNRSGVYAMILCIATAMFSVFFFLTQFLQNVLGWSPIRTGAGFLPMSAGILVGAGLSSMLVGKIGIRMPLLIGPGGAVVGLALLSRITIASSYLEVVGPLLLISVCMGLAFVPISLTAVKGVAAGQTGLASALLNTGQQVGGALGLAVLATVAIDATTSKLQSLATVPHEHETRSIAVAIATTNGYSTAFEVAAFIALAALLISLLVIRGPSAETLRSDVITANPDAEAKSTNDPLTQLDVRVR